MLLPLICGEVSIKASVLSDLNDVVNWHAHVVQV